MLRAYIREGDRLVATDFDPDAPVELPEAVWYSLIDPSREEDKFVEACLGIDIPTRREMQDIEPSARLYTEEGAEFMTITALVDTDGDQPVKTPITFVLRNNQLVTVRYADPKPFRLFERLVSRPTGYQTGERVMIGLLESFIDRLAQLLETTGDEIDQISREVFGNKSTKPTRKTRDLQSLIERIGKKGDTLTLARESLVSITRLVSFHQTPDTGIVPKELKELRQGFKTLLRDAAALSDHAAFLSDKITFLLDATLGLINLEQNQIIKIFSVAAVVFLPPTLVASIYGMNFDFMPELAWPFGYPLALGLMVLSAALPYMFFKRSGWL
jgi:magnesium transporter